MALVREVRQMTKLTGQNIADLSALLAGALSLDDLENYVHASTGDRLYVEYLAPGKPRRPTIIDLLNVLEERGTTAMFLRYVYVHRPGRPDVRNAIAQLCPEAAVTKISDKGTTLSAQIGGIPQPDAPTKADAPGLQRNVRPHLAKLDLRVWLERWKQIERRVCRVELEANALGTGFLVGPDTVLTNWHVVEQVRNDGKLGNVGCRFDYLLLPDGTRQAGQFVTLHADGCLDSSPYSEAEKTSTPETPPPTKEELDYALLRLARTIGRQQAEGTLRGWMPLPGTAMPLPADAPLLIVQHPDGAPMKLAMDTQAVIGRNAGETRIR